jgi:hypothetical protein
MQRKRLPSSLLVTLGLVGCGPTVPTDSTAGGTESQSGSQEGPMTDPSLPPNPSVDPPDPSDPSTFTTGPCLSPGSSGCLDATSNSFIDPLTGPCLSLPDTESWTSTDGTDTDTDTETDGDTDTDTDTDTGPGSNAGDAPAPSRHETLQRLVEAGILPADLARRLTRSE